MAKYHDLRVVRSGSSNVVVIPRDMSEEIGIAHGDFLRISIQKLKLVPAEETPSSMKRKDAISGKVPRDPRLFSGKVIKPRLSASEPLRVSS